MAGIKSQPLGLGQVGAQPSGQHRLLDKTRDMLVVQSAGQGAFTIARDGGEDRAKVDARKMQPVFQRLHRASLFAGAAARDLDLAPAGLAAQPQQHAAGQDLDPAAAVGCVIAAVIEADEFGPPQAARKADQQHRRVAQPAQVVGQGGDHRANILGQDCLFLHWRARVFAPDPGKTAAICQSRRSSTKPRCA